jgi:predicted metal-dependent HD superfamily phosphohydrolase
MNQHIKERFWTPLEASHQAGAWDIIDSCYSETQRAYHTWAHIEALLERLGEFSDLCVRSDILAMAIFWHDSVYRTENTDGTPRQDWENVYESAELFRHYTLLKGSDADAVYDLIMATANHLDGRIETHYYAGFADDLDLFLDLDLSFLAVPWDEFLEGLARIRLEFSSTTDATFLSRQIHILSNYIKSDKPLYRRIETSERWSASAVNNLRRCIDELQHIVAELKSGQMPTTK